MIVNTIHYEKMDTKRVGPSKYRQNINMISVLGPTSLRSRPKYQTIPVIMKNLLPLIILNKALFVPKKCDIESK